MLTRGREFARWTNAAIDAECATAYRAYAKDVRVRHQRYFEAHPERRGSTHDFAARDLEAALPPRAGAMKAALAAGSWHRYHLSGGSSQVLAVAVVSALTRAQSRLSWLPGAASLGERRLGLFEVELAPEVLNEHPRQTTLDYLALGNAGVVAVEAKFTERGFGICSCARRAEGICSDRVMERPYWKVAGRQLGIQHRGGQKSCPLSVLYQPVRNIAAAAAIAGPSRKATFVLLYDVRNPYFAGSGRWDGWVAILASLARYASVDVRAASWQSLLGYREVAPEVVEWAREKHGIEAQTRNGDELEELLRDLGVDGPLED